MANNGTLHFSVIFSERVLDVNIGSELRYLFSAKLDILDIVQVREYAADNFLTKAQEELIFVMH